MVVLDIGGTDIRDFAFWLNEEVQEDIPGLFCRNCALIERGSKLKVIALLGQTAEERILETKKDDGLIFFSRTIKNMLYTDLNVKVMLNRKKYQRNSTFLVVIFSDDPSKHFSSVGHIYNQALFA